MAVRTAATVTQNINATPALQPYLKCHRCCILVVELGIDRAHHVIRDVVTDVEILYLTKLCKLLKHILVEIL